MNRIILIPIGAFAIFLGCEKESSPVSVPSASPQMAFVIDTLSLQAVVQSNVLQIPVRAVYHFEGKPGSLLRFRLQKDSLGFDVLLSPARPTPTGSQTTFSEAFQTSNLYFGNDSIYVHFGFVGTFWERIDTTIYTYANFERSDSAWVRIQR